jgi:hypothetical protein
MNDEQTYLSFQPSEMAVFRGACSIYAGYVAAGNAGEESMKKAIDEALRIAVAVERAVESDNELKGPKTF